MIRRKIMGCMQSPVSMKNNWTIPVTEMAGHDAIIDVRTPAEFAEDHIPGAINLPVLSNEERVRVGTMYKQISPFEAKKVGGALVAQNIARHLLEQLIDKPKDWKPLIYCWRGGQRSGAMQIILRQVGWAADKLEGGYKAFRNHVMADTERLAGMQRWHVVCGATGSAKTRILQQIEAQGGQILDLETLAAHKGSVLGHLPDQPQPSQKGFETLVWQHLSQLNPQRPVFVEAESRKIGNLHVPEPLIVAMRAGRCLDVNATLQARVQFLLRDYDYAQQDNSWLFPKLERLKDRQGSKVIADWEHLAMQGQWAELVEQLLSNHYDPLYRQSQGQNYTGERPWPPFGTDDLSEAGIATLAARMLQAVAT